MVQKLKRLKRELAHSGAIVNMYEDSIEMPNGKVVKWDFIEHPKGAAAILPVLPDGRILMVRQYRNALDRITLEIPAGARDSVTEDTAVCARRELKEETGYSCGKIEKLLSLKSTVAFCDELIDVYLATELTKGEQHLDEDEEIYVEEWSVEDLQKLIYSGKMTDAKTVAAIMAYAQKYC